MFSQGIALIGTSDEQVPEMLPSPAFLQYFAISDDAHSLALALRADKASILSLTI